MSIAPKPIILWQMPPIWGLPNPSPFCMKLETWLRMSGLPYEAKAITGPPKSKSGKIPYIERRRRHVPGRQHDDHRDADAASTASTSTRS